MRTIPSQNNFRNGKIDQNYYLPHLLEAARAVGIRFSSTPRTGFLRYPPRPMSLRVSDRQPMTLSWHLINTIIITIFYTVYGSWLL